MLLPLTAPPSAHAADPGIAPRADVESFLSHQVYGYLPYWRLNAGTAGQLDYDLLSTIAFFGLGIKADGNIDTAWRGSVAYMSDNAAAVTNAAHAKGVRVVPTFQLFDSGSLPKMTAFLDSRTAQDRFIAQALDLMARRSPTARTSTSNRCRRSMTARYLSFLVPLQHRDGRPVPRRDPRQRDRLPARRRISLLASSRSSTSSS